MCKDNSQFLRTDNEDLSIDQWFCVTAIVQQGRGGVSDD